MFRCCSHRVYIGIYIYWKDECVIYTAFLSYIPSTVYIITEYGRTASSVVNNGEHMHIGEAFSHSILYTVDTHTHAFIRRRRLSY